jgi:hypothetical protein
MAQAAQARRLVRQLLAAVPAYSQLPPDKQRQIGHDMARVAVYTADPHGLVSKEARQPVLTRGCSGTTGRPSLPRRLDRSSRDGLAVLTSQLSRFDFPTFVSALINGVFHAIVDATIQQMQA